MQEFSDIRTLVFDLCIQSVPDGCTIQVTASPSGEAESRFISQEDVDTFACVYRDLLEKTLSAAALKNAGQALFNFVFDGTAFDLYRESIGRAQVQNKQLHIRLFINASSLASLPWELLYDRKDDYFLCISSQTLLSRYVGLPEPVCISVDSAYVRLLIVASGDDAGKKSETTSADTSTLPGLAITQEIAAIRSALADLEKSQSVKIVELSGNPSIQAVRSKLREFHPHIVHFIGHGYHDAGTALLIFAGEGDNPPFLVDEDHFRDLIDSAPELQMVVLNACYTATSNLADLISGVAIKTLQRGVGSVIAMQAAIPDRMSVMFAHAFYRRLSQGYSIEEAVFAARQALRDSENIIPSLFTPVLFQRSQPGSLVLFPDATGDTPPDRPAEPPNPPTATLAEPEAPIAEIPTSWLQRAWRMRKEIGMGVLVEFLAAALLLWMGLFWGWVDREVWGRLSCHLPDIRVWSMTILVSLMLSVLFWRHRKQIPFISRYQLHMQYAIGAVVIIALALLFRSEMQPDLMPLSTQSFNIVVSTFGGGAGNTRCNTKSGSVLTEEVIHALQRQFSTSQSTVAILQIAHLHSETEAIQMARSLNASVLVWGWMLEEDDSGFVPQFVIYDGNDAWEPSLLKAETVIAERERAVQINRTQIRVTVLSDLIFGLLSMAGDSQDDYKLALQYFRSSLRTVEAQQEATSLLPLLYYYTGRISNHLGNTAEAEALFDKGLALEPEYAILYLNKGNVFYNQARRMMGDDPDRAWDLLEQASQHYQRAMSSLKKENNQFVDAKAHANLGQVALTRGQIQLDQSHHFFQQAVEEYARAMQLFIDAEAPICHHAQVAVSQGMVYEALQEVNTAHEIYVDLLDQYESCAAVANIARERLSVLGHSD